MKCGLSLALAVVFSFSALPGTAQQPREGTAQQPRENDAQFGIGRRKARVERAARSVAAELKNTADRSETVVYRHLQEFLTRNRTVFGATVASPPHVADPRLISTVHLFRQGNQFARESNPAFNFVDADDATWYRTALTEKRGIWTEPYDAADGSGRRTTFALPIYADAARTRLLFIFTAHMLL